MNTDFKIKFDGQQPQIGKRIVIMFAQLNIVKIPFYRNFKWDFIFDGNKISAKTDASLFQTRIDQGETFAKGDVLDVELAVRQKFDPTVNTYLNKSYKINRIINHLRREEDPKLNFDS